MTTFIPLFKPIIASPPGITIESDSSKLGWGAINKTSCKTVQGLWSSDETDIHINILEMKAAFSSPTTFLLSFAKYSCAFVFGQYSCNQILKQDGGSQEMFK